MKLSLGAAQLGQAYGVAQGPTTPSDRDAAAILSAAARLGFDSVDTAPAYGRSELLIGKWRREHRHALRVVTKTSGAIEPRSLQQSFVESLSRLGVESVDAVLVHDASTIQGSTGRRLRELVVGWREQGLASRVGVSIYEEADLDALRDFPADLIQLPLSIFDQRLYGRGVIRDLHEAGIEIYARSALLQGVLVMNADAVPPGLRSARPHLRAFQAACREQDLSPLEAALGFVANVAGVTGLVIGVNRTAELEQCRDAVRAGATVADPAAFAVLDPSVVDPRTWVE